MHAPPMPEQASAPLHRVECADALTFLRSLPDCSVDALVSDPPYGLSQHGADDVASCLAAWLAGDEYRHGKAGFMGRTWDSWVPGPEVWREVLRVLKPGGHACIFAGTRTVDLMGIALRLAGFEIRDSLHWIYGTGFPKSHNIGKAIDKAAGAEREVVGSKVGRPGYSLSPERGATSFREAGGMSNPAAECAITAPATPGAAQWEGWGTALKPAHEPVIWARKPLNPVPFGDTVADLTNAVEGLLWSLSSARLVEAVSESSRVEHGAARSGGVRWIAGVLSMGASEGRPAPTGTFNSQVEASTFWSIVGSWSAILDALLTQESTSTTSTATAATTALKTWSCWAFASMPATIAKAVTLGGGLWSNAGSAGESSSAGGLSWTHIPTPSAGERVTSRTARTLASELARIAGEISPCAEGRAAPSIATRSATTGRAAPDDHRPIILARKPLSNTVAANVLEHGTGGLNVDGCRVGLGEMEDAAKLSARSGGSPGFRKDGYVNGAIAGGLPPGWDCSKGRWPPNIILTHAPGCPGDKNGAGCVDGCAVGELGAQSGVTQSSGGAFVGRSGVALRASEPTGGMRATRKPGIGDEGTAARFFPSFRYCAKASRSEREAGLEPPADGKRANRHPTVKPIDLMRWLVRLVTPPGGVVLDPFTGSGTTGCAAALEGFAFVGCEMDAGHADLARRRVAHWAGRAVLASPVVAAPRPQLELFA